MAFTSFSISQAFLGAPLQFYPVLGSLELEELINAFVTGSSSKAEKMSEVTLDFFNNATVDLNTGALVRHYNVYSTPAATWPPTQSNSSGFSPAIYTPSPASSTAATSFGDSGYGSFSAEAKIAPIVKNSNSVTTGRVSKKSKKTSEARLPGFSIMTKDGVDVTNSAGRGTKTKEQREHAHLMRIMKACEACKKKKVRCDPSHRRAQTDMSRTSTTSSSSASAANTHKGSSTSSGTSSAIPSPPTNKQSIPAFTNALDDFVLFPQDLTSWNPYSSDANIPNDFDMSDFNFDTFDVSAGGLDFNEFSPLDQNTSFFQNQSQFQQVPDHMGVDFGIPDYAPSQQSHGQEDAWNEGANGEQPLQALISQRPAISPSDESQVQIQQPGRNRHSSSRRPVVAEESSSTHQSRAQSQACPLHELGSVALTTRLPRGANRSSRNTPQQGSFPLERYLQSDSAPLVSQDFGAVWDIATNSHRSTTSASDQMHERDTSHSPMDWGILDISTIANENANANAAGGRPHGSLASVTQTQQQLQTSRGVLAQQELPSASEIDLQDGNVHMRDANAHATEAYATAPLSASDQIHELSQRPQLARPRPEESLRSLRPELQLQSAQSPLGDSDLQAGDTQSPTPVVQSPWSFISHSLFWLVLALSMVMVSSPLLAHLHQTSWDFPRMALSALLLSYLPSPFPTSSNGRSSLENIFRAWSTLILMVGGTFLSSLFATTSTCSHFDSDNISSSTSLPKGKAAMAARGMFGVDIDVGMGSGRGIVTPWVVSMLREVSEEFAFENSNADVMMME